MQLSREGQKKKLRDLAEIVLLCILGLLFVKTASAKEAKEYFLSVPPKVRKEILSTARVRKDESEIQKANPDILEDLSNRCGWKYARDASGAIIQPTVECEYIPKPKNDPFSGRTSKFDCRYQEFNSDGTAKLDKNGNFKFKTSKVKYESTQKPGGGYKEIPQAILGSEIGLRLGFYANTYCPANLICRNCPNNHPWSLSDHSTGPATPGNVVPFPNVVIEIRQKGDKVQDTDNLTSKMGEGFALRGELLKYLPAKSKEDSKGTTLRARLLREREALGIWVNFIRHLDADPHNNRLLCLSATEPQTAGEIPKCEVAAAYVTDYGNSFGYSDTSTPLSLKDFSRSTLRTDGNDVVAYGAAASSSNFPVSTAGRSLFVSAASKISDQQLADIFSLAQVEVTSDAGKTREEAVKAWIAAFRAKVEKIRTMK